MFLYRWGEERDYNGKTHKYWVRNLQVLKQLMSQLDMKSKVGNDKTTFFCRLLPTHGARTGVKVATSALPEEKTNAKSRLS